MSKKLIITVSVILCLLITAAVIYRINYEKQRGYELYVSNEEYEINIHPPVDREYTKGSEYEYFAECEIRLNTSYDGISPDEYYSKMNETICMIIDDVNSYIADKNINEKFRIYIKTEAQKDYCTFEFYNYYNIFKYSKDIEEKYGAEMESIGVSSNFISCSYCPYMYENAISKKYAIELLNSLGIKYLIAGGYRSSNLDLTGLDYSDFEKLKPITLLVESNFIVSDDIYEILSKAGMLDHCSDNVYKVDCSERDDLDWYFNREMFLKINSEQ